MGGAGDGDVLKGGVGRNQKGCSFVSIVNAVPPVLFQFHILGPGED